MLMCLLSERCVVERERERERDSPSIRRAHAEVVDEAFFFGGQIPMGVVYAIHL
jgi:hypothetical protein